VSPIVDAVRHQGDAAVREYTAKFDRVNLDIVCSPIEVQTCSRCNAYTGGLPLETQ